jgi:PAS domain S-box-containing protein
LLGAKQITNADVLAIYLADNIKPGATLFTTIQNSSQLPHHIPIHDIIALREPYTWLPTKSPKTTLHRSAKLLGLNYMITIPLGEENAIIGLLIVASKSREMLINEIEVAKLIANSITSIVSNYSSLSNVKNELEQKKSQLAVHSGLEEYISEGFILIDDKFTLSRINHTAEQMLGYSNEEISGQPLKNFLITNKEIISAISEVQHDRKKIKLENLQVYRRNGESFLAILNIFPIGKEKLLSNETAILIQDLSEQEQIRNHAQQLEQRAFLGEITAIFAHEVRNPINNISTGLQLMALNLPPDDHNQQGGIRRLGAQNGRDRHRVQPLARRWQLHSKIHIHDKPGSHQRHSSQGRCVRI